MYIRVIDTVKTHKNNKIKFIKHSKLQLIDVDGTCILAEPLSSAGRDKGKSAILESLLSSNISALTGPVEL